MDGRDRPGIDWGSARVRGGTLVVELTGIVPRGWLKQFGAVQALLPHNEANWGKVRLTKKAITVGDVQEGSEEALRHFLQSILLQVNSDFEPGTLDGAVEREDDPLRASDLRMAATFRSFADRAS